MNLVADNEDREKKGNFVTAAVNVTPEVIKFMSKYGRGLDCASFPEERCEDPGLELVVNNNIDLHETTPLRDSLISWPGMHGWYFCTRLGKIIQAFSEPFTILADQGRPITAPQVKKSLKSCLLKYLGMDTGKANLHPGFRMRHRD